MGAFLLAWFPALVLRVLTMLGIGTLTFTGVATGIDALIQSAVTNWTSLPTDVLQLASLAGVPQGLGIITGAITAKVGLWVAVSATRFVAGLPTSA